MREERFVVEQKRAFGGGLKIDWRCVMGWIVMTAKAGTKGHGQRVKEIV